jgi:hypothetical protein
VQFRNHKNQSTGEDIATRIFTTLKAKGFKLGPGLNGQEIEAVKNAFRATLPPDLKLLRQQ